MHKFSSVLFSFLVFVAYAEGPESVSVPVPEDLKSRGELQVSGIRGSEQSETFTYQRCEAVEKSTPVEIIKNGCKEVKLAPLNKSISVRTGYYMLTYSRSRYAQPVEVKKDERATVVLQRISVPKENGKFEFHVFADLTNPAEQEKFMRAEWNYNKDQDYHLGLCSGLNWLTPSDIIFSDFCEATRTTDYKIFRAKSVRFEKNGTFNEINFSYRQDFSAFITRPYWKNSGRVWITDPHDGAFVSVFPGVYGIYFKDTRNGEVSEKYGIVVNEEISHAAASVP